MNIPLDPMATVTTTTKASASETPTAPRSNKSVASPTQETRREVPVTAQGFGGQQPNVTFRRDTNGRIYYVISDPQSGEDIQELPPKAVRQVATGIDEYLQQKQTKHTPLNTKG